MGKTNMKCSSNITLDIIPSFKVRLERNQLDLLVQYGRILDLPAFREDGKEKLSEESHESEKKQKEGGVFLRLKNEAFFSGDPSYKPFESDESVPTTGSEEDLQDNINDVNQDMKETQNFIDREIKNLQDSTSQTDLDDSKKLKEEKMIDDDGTKNEPTSSNQTQKVFCNRTLISENGDQLIDCDYKTKWMSELKRHTASKHDGIRYECDICHAKFSVEKNLRAHKKNRHEGLSFPCDKCDFKALNIHQLKAHEQSKHEGVTYKCKKCEERFHYKNSLRRHNIAKHLGLKFKCDSCGTEYVSKDHMRAHRRKCRKIDIATKTKFPCLHCDEKFQLKAMLGKHIKAKHPGVRALREVRKICPYCEKEFNKEKPLKLHVRNHEEEEGKHRCHHCKEVFRLKPSLDRHINSVHLGIKYPCQHCGKELVDPFKHRRSCPQKSVQ